MITLPPSKHAILVLSTNLQMRQALERALSDQGYRNLVACDLAESLRIAADPSVQLCVLEWEEGRAEAVTEIVQRLRLETSVARFILIADPVSGRVPPANVRSKDVQVLSRPFSMLEFIAVVDHAQR